MKNHKIKSRWTYDRLSLFDLILLSVLFSLTSVSTTFAQSTDSHNGQGRQSGQSPHDDNAFLLRSKSGGMIIRYRAKIASEPLGEEQNQSGIQHSLTTSAYCGLWDFRFWLLHDRADVQDDLGMTESQSKKLSSVEKQFSSLRQRFRDAINQIDGTEERKAQMRIKLAKETEAITGEMERALKEWLSANQLNRLMQLERQYTLSRYPEEMIRSLPDRYRETTGNELRDPTRDMKRLQAAFARPGDSSDRLAVSLWLKSALGEEKARKILDKIRKSGLLRLQIAELKSLEDLTSLEDSLEANGERESLWHSKSTLGVSPTGVAEITFEKSTTSATYNLLMNLGRNPSMQRSLELAEFQIEQSRKAANSREEPEQGVLKSLVSSSDLNSELENILLPHQFELLEEHEAWREAELYGLAASLVAGRLKKICGIAEQQIEKLRETAPQVVAELDTLMRNKYREKLQSLKQEMLETGFGKFGHSYFGKASDTVTFRY